MPHLDYTVGLHHPPEQIAAWMRTLAALHAEHEQSPRKRAQIEHFQAQAQKWLRARAERRHPRELKEPEAVSPRPARGPARVRKAEPPRVLSSAPADA